MENADDVRKFRDITGYAINKYIAISSFQVMSGRPLPGGCRGLHALKLLKDLAPILEPSFVEMWDTVIPKLTQYLEGGKKYHVLRFQISQQSPERSSVLIWLISEDLFVFRLY